MVDTEEKWKYNGTAHQLLIDLKNYDSVRREVLYNILIESGIPRKLVGLIKICLNETYITVHISKNLSDKFPTKWPETRRCFITIAFQLCFGIRH
jgi:hypothetical protein